MLIHQSISYGCWDEGGIYIQPFIFIELILFIEAQRLFLVWGFLPLKIMLGVAEYF